MYSLSYIKRKSKQRKLLKQYENQLHIIKNTHNIALYLREYQLGLYYIDCIMKLNLSTSKMLVENIDKKVGYSILSNVYDSLTNW